jgi:hypothetical protein
MAAGLGPLSRGDVWRRNFNHQGRVRHRVEPSLKSPHRAEFKEPRG